MSEFEIEITVRSPLRPRPTSHDAERMERETLAQLRVGTDERTAWVVFEQALSELTDTAAKT